MSSDVLAFWTFVLGVIAAIITAAGVYLAFYIGRASGQLKKPDLRLYLFETKLVELRPGRERSVVFVLPKKDRAKFACTLPVTMVNTGERDAEDVVVEAVGPPTAVTGLGNKWGTKMDVLGGPVKSVNINCFETERYLRWCFEFGNARRGVTMRVECPFVCVSSMIDDIVAPVTFKDGVPATITVSRSFWFRYDLFVKGKDDDPTASSVTVNCLFGTDVQEGAREWFKNRKKLFTHARRHPFPLSKWLDLARTESRTAVIIIPDFTVVHSAPDGSELLKENAFESRRWVLTIGLWGLLVGSKTTTARLTPIPRANVPADASGDSDRNANARPKARKRGKYI